MACFFWGVWPQMKELACGEGLSLCHHVGSLIVQGRSLICLALFSLHCPSEMQFSLPSFYPCALCCVAPEFLELQPVFAHCSVCSYRGVNCLPNCLWCKTCCLSCLLLCTKGTQEAQSATWMWPVFA